MPDVKTCDTVLNDAVRYEDALEKISTLAAAGGYIAGDGDLQLSFELFAYIDTVARKAIYEAMGTTDKE